MLEEILKYHETPEDDNFVAEVIRSVRQQQRIRRLILTVTGIAGGAFGAVGVLTISNSIGRFITDANILPASVALVGIAAFLAWLFQDEVTTLG